MIYIVYLTFKIYISGEACTSKPPALHRAGAKKELELLTASDLKLAKLVISASIIEETDGNKVISYRLAKNVVIYYFRSPKSYYKVHPY